MAEEIRLIPREIREGNFPIARFLSEEEQTKYEESCKSFGEKARKYLNISINGSNLFKALLLNQTGIKTATLPELDLIVDENPNFLKGTYEDAPSVVLRSAGDSHQPNDYLVKGLAKLILRKSFKNPVVINGLEIINDKNSYYGLGFKFGEKFAFFEAPELSHVNHQKTFSRLDERGMPIFDKDGKRTLYTREDGVSRFYLYWCLDLSSGNEALAYSSGTGRVVVVSAEGASQKISEYITQLQKQRTDAEAQLTSKFNGAVKVIADAYKQAEAVLRSK